ncbi:hypothetical protein SK3146_00121 [Paenibacillus konkukensis]|uniref:Uncharacterized protein n=1 Tax=Paenibacillus konkukensis TaxID=2020716 RepID=A0ABY4RGK8_9BACL|nr:hypothetical protein [Paenibacillus konkukensis]UQZ80965.1 hypothetical protein SK3146_00121 [Paenibacillus konkukensis]
MREQLSVRRALALQTLEKQLEGIAYASKGDLESGIVARADVIGGGPKRKITDNLTSDE